MIGSMIESRRLAEKLKHRRVEHGWCFEWCHVAGMRHDQQPGLRDDLRGPLEALWRGDLVFSAHHQERRQADVTKGFGHVGPRGEGRKRGDDRFHSLAPDHSAKDGLGLGAIGCYGRLSRSRSKPGNHRLRQNLWAEPLHLRGEVGAAGPRLGSVGFQLRIDKHERPDPRRIADRHMLRHVAAH